MSASFVHQVELRRPKDERPAMLNMLLAFCKLGNTIDDLGRAELDSVETVAASNTSVATLAESVLARVKRIQYNRVPKPVPVNRNSKVAGNEEEQISESIPLKFFPNPASSSVTAKYMLPPGSGQAQLIFYDITGREIFVYPIDTRKNGQIYIETTALPQGLILVSLIVDKKPLFHTRLVIIK